jgi:hypothetical protein
MQEYVPRKLNFTMRTNIYDFRLTIYDFEISYKNKCDILENFPEF